MHAPGSGLLSSFRLIGWNATEQRLRAGWRFVISLVTVLLAVALTAAVPLPVTGELQSVVLELVLRACVVVGLALGLARIVDRRSVRDFGFEVTLDWGYRFAAGVSVAVFILAGATVTLLSTGWAVVDSVVVSPGIAFVPAVLFTAVYALCVGVWEEAVFRGLLLRNAAEGLTGRVGPRTAVAVSCVGVAVLHALLRLPALPSARVLPFYVLVSSVYGIAYLVTADLGFPIGLHAGVDFAAIAVFGYHDVTVFPAVLDTQFTGPSLAVGVDGLVMFSWMLVGTLLVVALASQSPRLSGDALAVTERRTTTEPTEGHSQENSTETN